MPFALFQILSSVLLLLAWFCCSATAQKLTPPNPARKAVPVKEKLSEAEIAEAREQLGLLGYWVDLEAKGLDASLHHALIAFQKIEGRRRTGVL